MRPQAAIFLCIAIGATALTGCGENVDLASLQDLAKSTAASSASYAALANDFDASCLRTAGWQRAAAPNAAPNVFASCTEEAKAAKQWQAANDVVTSYVAALGTLAGATPDAGDYGLKDFAAALAGMPGNAKFSAAQQSSAASAAGAILADYVNVQRREALGRIVPQADADLDTMISTLEDIAKTNYVTSLTSERIAIRLFFEPNVARALPGIERLVAFNYRMAEKAQLDAVDDRQAAVEHYVASLESIRKTHHAIAAAVASGSTSEIPSAVAAYLTETGPEIAAIAKAEK